MTQDASILCILIVEVAGDALLTAKLGELEAQRAIDRCLTRALRSIEAYQGRCVSKHARGFVAVFERCDKGLLAASDVRERIAQLPPVSGVQLNVRIGVHAEEAIGEPTVVALGVLNELKDCAKPGQILVTSEVSMYASEGMRTNIGTRSEIVLSCHGDNMPLYELPMGSLSLVQTDSGGPSTEASKRVLASATPPKPRATGDGPRARLMLRYASSSYVINETHPVLLAGREEGNDLIVTDRRASRQHARVEWRNGSYVLIDSSTNGTFLVDENGQEVLLKQSQRSMPQSGRIGFGSSPLEPGVDAAYFDMGPR